MVTHPGIRIRQGCLDPNGLSVTGVARVLGCNRQTLSNVLNGRAGISHEMALRLHKAFGAPARYWMEHQMNYELDTIMARGHEVEVQPLPRSIR